MYSHQQASQIQQGFWTTFGQYMKPVLSSEGEKINWINYKTGEKGIHFQMKANNKEASICIEITHEQQDVRQLYFNHFKQLKQILDTTLQEEWIWQLHALDEHEKLISKIETSFQNINIFSKEDWPAFISFFKPRIIALDAFWNNVKYSFEVLKF